MYIQTHNFPDPDAISSAFGLQKLLKARGVDATICYKGKIDRYNTNKMLELFHIEAYDVDTLPQINKTDEIIIDALKGIGTGGGHSEMAGGFVPFDSTDYDEVELVKVIKERFTQSVHKHTK